MTQNKKALNLAKIFGIVATVTALIAFFMGFLNSFKEKGTPIEDNFWHFAFSEKITSLIVIFSSLLIVISILIAAFITNLVKKDKISGILFLVGSIIMFISAILSLLAAQLLAAEAGSPGSTEFTIDVGPILIGVFGFISSGFGITSGVLNLKK